jgi:hypothetical protein
MMNLKGHIVKDGKVVYSEQLKQNLHFVVIAMYEPKYQREHYQSSSQMLIQAVITNGNKTKWSNGVDSFQLAQETQEKPFKPIETITTKQGFKAWQQDYNYRGVYRDVVWIIEVPKHELLAYAQSDI